MRMKKKALVAFCMAFFASVPCFAASASGISVGSSQGVSESCGCSCNESFDGEGYVVSEGTSWGSGYSSTEGTFEEEPSSVSQGESTSCVNCGTNCLSSSRELSEEEIARERDKAPLMIVADGGIPFSVSVSPMHPDTMSDKAATVVFSTKLKGVRGIGLSFRDPYSKTIRHIPVKQDEAVEIVSRDHIRYCAGITRLYFSVVMEDGITTTAVVDMHILEK